MIETIGDNACNVVEKRYFYDFNEGVVSSARYYVIFLERLQMWGLRDGIVVDGHTMARMDYDRANMTDTALVVIIKNGTVYYFDTRIVLNYTVQRFEEDGFIPLHYAKIDDPFENKTKVVVRV